MRLLTRYVLAETLKVFLVTLTALTSLMILVGVGKEAVTQGLGLVHVVQLMPYLLPNALMFAVPGTILFAVSMVFGRMAGGNEVVAVKSLGISPMTLVWPPMVLSIVLSFVTVWLNDLAMSWGNDGVQRVILDAVEDIAYGMLRTQRSYATKAFSVSVKRVDGRTLVQPTFTFQGAGDSPSVSISAKEAEMRSDRQSGLLTMIFRSGTIEVAGATYDFPGEERYDVSLTDATLKGKGDVSPSHLPLRELPRRIKEQQLQIERYKQSQAVRAAYQMFTGDFSALAEPAWAATGPNLQGQFDTLYRLRTEVPRRWANGFSCFCFALIGAPMAMRRKSADVLSNFFACFLPILLIYYPLMIYGVDRAKDGALPAIAVWLANGILCAWGWWLLRRELRY